MHALKFLLYLLRMKISQSSQSGSCTLLMTSLLLSRAESRLTPLRIDIFVLTHLRIRNEISPKIIIGGTHLLAHKLGKT